NCTIQELKHVIQMITTLTGVIFQLHHTGIKTTRIHLFLLLFLTFQLHHTGIKTYRMLNISCFALISIAPYRN
ncbi:hypothetical protein HMPREF1988_02029, partial [Porphyromonas gingivalis F0185]